MLTASPAVPVCYAGVPLVRWWHQVRKIFPFNTYPQPLDLLRDDSRTANGSKNVRAFFFGLRRLADGWLQRSAQHAFYTYLSEMDYVVGTMEPFAKLPQSQQIVCHRRAKRCPLTIR